ncbi:hypothetical protein ACVR1G_02255 [Streptococcus dentasini]
MVKMVLGSSDTQASSVATLADNYTTGFESILSAISTLKGSDKLKGTAYTNAKEYGDTVVTPLAKGMILLAEAAKTDTQMLPDRYRSDVGEDELSDDTEVLSAEIEALNTTINTNNSLLEGMASDDPNRTTAENAVNSDTAERDKRQKKLDKINAYDAASSGFFSDIAGLEADVSSGLTLLNQGIAGFNGSFTMPSKGQLKWAKNINKEFKQYQNYQSAVAKAQKGEELSEEEAKAVEAYKKKHPGLEIDKSVTKASNDQLAAAKAEKSAQDLSEETGISYEAALNYILTGKIGSDMKKIVDSSETAGKIVKNARKEFLENKYVKASKITTDKAGNVKVGNKMLYNKETGHVYDANGNRVKRGKAPHGQSENSQYKKAVGEDIDPDKTYVGKERGFNAEGFKTAKKSAKIAAKNGLKVWDDFDWRKSNMKGVGKVGKALKGLGMLSSAIELTGNVKENFIDDKKSSVGEKIKNFTADEGGDIVTGAASASAGAAAGAAIGSLIPIPGVGTVAGAVVGYGVGKLLDHKWGKSENSSASGAIKSGIKGLLGG